MGALQTNVEYLTDRIINNSAPNSNNNTSNANYAALGSDQHLVANSSNDFDVVDPQIKSAIDQNEGTTIHRLIDILSRDRIIVSFNNIILSMILRI